MLRPISYSSTALLLAGATLLSLLSAVLSIVIVDGAAGEEGAYFAADAPTGSVSDADDAAHGRKGV